MVSNTAAAILSWQARGVKAMSPRSQKEKASGGTRQGKNGRRTGVYKTVHEDSEPIFNAVSCRLRPFQPVLRIPAATPAMVTMIARSSTGSGAWRLRCNSSACSILSGSV